MSEENFNWTPDATARIEKVPAGFMRNMTKMRVEEHAKKNNIKEIDLSTVEEVVTSSRAGMGSAMGGDMSGMASMMGQMGHPAEIPKPEQESQAKDTYYHCFVCGYVVKNEMPAKCSNCASDKEKFSLIEEQFVTPSSMKPLEWSQNAISILKKVPQDFRQEMTKWEIEGFCRKNGYLAVTADVVEERYKVWEGVAKKTEQRLAWCDEVTQKIEKIPPSIRGMVVKEMENFADKKGETLVSIETLNSIREKWVNQQEFHVKWQK